MGGYETLKENSVVHFKCLNCRTISKEKSYRGMRMNA